MFTIVQISATRLLCGATLVYFAAAEDISGQADVFIQPIVRCTQRVIKRHGSR